MFCCCVDTRQMTWHLLMKPLASSFKFRLPWGFSTKTGLDMRHVLRQSVAFPDSTQIRHLNLPITSKLKEICAMGHVGCFTISLQKSSPQIPVPQYFCKVQLLPRLFAQMSCSFAVSIQGSGITPYLQGRIFLPATLLSNVTAGRWVVALGKSS